MIGIPLGVAPLGAEDAPFIANWVEELTQAGAVADALTSQYRYVRLIVDAPNIADTLASAIAPHIRERVALVESWSPSSQIAVAITQSGVFLDTLQVAMSALVADGADGSDTISDIRKFVPMLEETLLALGLVETRQQATDAVIEALVITDLIKAGWTAEAIDAATIVDIVSPVARQIIALVDAANAADAAIDTLRLVALLSESTAVDATLNTSAQFTALIADGATFSGTIRIGNTEYQCFVMNTKNKAVTEYQNFPFNSFAKFGDTYYGASETGLYALTGDTDDSAEIDAWVRAAISTLGTGKKKRMPAMYLGYTSSGTLVLKVITTREDGAKVEDWYQMTTRTASAHRENRIKVGRGLQSVYWAWEIHNKAGADFSLDVVELFPMILERRI